MLIGFSQVFDPDLGVDLYGKKSAGFSQFTVFFRPCFPVVAVQPLFCIVFPHTCMKKLWNVVYLRYILQYST